VNYYSRKAGHLKCGEQQTTCIPAGGTESLMVSAFMSTFYSGESSFWECRAYLISIRSSEEDTSCKCVHLIYRQLYLRIMCHPASEIYLAVHQSKVSFH